MNLTQQLVDNKKVLALIGPTASGKSRLVMALAKTLKIEIISVDSALIYRYMNIGTAKPSEAELAAVPHHLINTHDPAESYSAADFVADVNRLVPEIFARQALPVLVGGTMMYFNALQNGLSVLPSANQSIRHKWLQEWEQNPDTLHAYLQKIDPQAAQRIHPNDPQRLVRAIEVFELTGKSLTHWQAQKQSGMHGFELIKFALIASQRAQLHQQIEKRFDEMLAQGFIEEVEQLFARADLHADLPAIRSVGYRQAWLYCQGEYDYEMLRYKALVATRQLAKRQLTWLRKEPHTTIIDPFKNTLKEQQSLILKHLSDIVEA